jgi:hypothetical protein
MIVISLVRGGIGPTVREPYMLLIGASIRDTADAGRFS